MSYLKSFEECLDSSLKEAYERGVLSESKQYLEKIKKSEDIESVLVIILSAFAKLDSKIFTDIQKVSELIDLDEAKGRALDNLGLLLGVYRPRSTYSRVSLLFTLEGNGEDIILPKGIVVSSKTGQTYITEEEIVFVKDKTDQEVSVLAKSQGTGRSQRVKSDSLTIINHTQGLPSMRVTNPQKSYGGLEPANDDEFRVYLKNWHQIHQRGNLWAYINYFREYDGLKDYKIIPKWDGPGTMKIIIDCDEKLEAYHKKQIYKDIFTHVGLADDDVVIQRSPAVQIPYDIHVNLITRSKNYTKEEKEALIKNVELLVNIFIEGGYIDDKNYHEGLSIGDSFIPFRLAVFIDENIPDVEIVKIITPSDVVNISPYSVLKPGKIIVDVE